MPAMTRRSQARVTICGPGRRAVRPGGKKAEHVAAQSRLGIDAGQNQCCGNHRQPGLGDGAGGHRIAAGVEQPGLADHLSRPDQFHEAGFARANLAEQADHALDHHPQRVRFLLPLEKRLQGRRDHHPRLGQQGGQSVAAERSEKPRAAQAHGIGGGQGLGW